MMIRLPWRRTIKANLFKGADCIEVVDAGKFRHRLDRNFNVAKFVAARLFQGDFQVLADRDRR